MKAAAFGILLAVSATSAGAEPTGDAAYLRDPAFQPAFDMYWRARLAGAAAGNRMCALPNKFYDDPKSPYRPLDDRLQRLAVRFESRFPKALNTVARPYLMPPPQALCDDPKAAWEGIFALETAVVALENLLDLTKAPQ